MVAPCKTNWEQISYTFEIISFHLTVWNQERKRLTQEGGYIWMPRQRHQYRREVLGRATPGRRAGIGLPWEIISFGPSPSHPVFWLVAWGEISIFFPLRRWMLGNSTCVIIWPNETLNGSQKFIFSHPPLYCRGRSEVRIIFLLMQQSLLLLQQL